MTSKQIAARVSLSERELAVLAAKVELHELYIQRLTDLTHKLAFKVLREKKGRKHA